MPSNSELNAAVEAGVIGRADADRLAAFFASRGSDAGLEDAETIRFVRGFHDIFLTIGVGLFIAGVGFVAFFILPRSMPFLVAIACWGLAEYFTRLKRLTLPSIALSIGFGAAAGLAQNVLLSSFDTGFDDNNTRAAIMALNILIASLVFYGRFCLPFTLGQIVIAAVFALNAFLNASAGPFQLSVTGADIPILLMGVIVFSFALHLDMKDPKRDSIEADKAFWLHLSAAPLIVHSMMKFFWENGAMSIFGAAWVIALIFFLALVALIIDRRALLVAGLSYFGVALFVIIRSAAIDPNAVLALTLLILGGALLMLGVGWRPLRAKAIGFLVPPAIARRLPTVRPD